MDKLKGLFLPLPIPSNLLPDDGPGGSRAETLFESWETKEKLNESNPS